MSVPPPPPTRPLPSVVDGLLFQETHIYNAIRRHRVTRLSTDLKTIQLNVQLWSLLHTTRLIIEYRRGKITHETHDESYVENAKLLSESNTSKTISENLKEILECQEKSLSETSSWQRSTPM